METGESTTSRCACARFQVEFWEAVLALRNQLRELALDDFLINGLPRRTGHMHELLNCIDDYLEIAREEGYFGGSD